MALVVTPGLDPVLPAVLRGRVALLERPLSARRVLNVGQPSRTEALSPAGPRLAGLRILAVEDNPVNQMVLAELLAQEGSRVTLTDHGAHALEQLQAQGREAFDLVLTDIQMPVMDGYETARRIVELAPDLPVVGLTARAMPEERERCLAAGMRDHVAKPVDIDELVAAILRHIGLPALAAIRTVTKPDATSALAPIVDWAALEQQFQDSPAFVARLVELTRQTQAETATQLRKAALEGDWQRLIFLTHSLKGVGGHLRAPRVLNLGQRSETAARQTDAGAALLAIQLADALDEMMGELARYQAARPAPGGVNPESRSFPD